MQRSGFLFDLWVFSLRVLAYQPLNIHAAAQQFFTELSEMRSVSIIGKNMLSHAVLQIIYKDFDF